MDISTIYVVIPAFNEEKKIGEVVSSVKEIFTNVVVVNDCSRDATSCVAEKSQATVLNHFINLGQGAALQTGIDYCKKRNAEYIVTFDADGQHSIADVKLMLDEIVKSNCDVVLGSRFLGESIGMPKSRKLLLKLAIIYTYLTTGLKLTDAHNGIRILSRKAIEKIKIRQNRMAHASEILEQIAENKLNYCEYPVTISYSEYSLQKGQKWWDAFPIIVDSILRKFR